MRTSIQRNNISCLSYSKNMNICLMTLGEFNMAPISLQLKDQGSKPVHARPYTVPRSIEKQLHKEITRLVDIRVLEVEYFSEWTSPTFSIAKKNGTIRVVSNFRKLNSLLQSHPFPISKIGNMICIMRKIHLCCLIEFKYGILSHQVRC